VVHVYGKGVMKAVVMAGGLGLRLRPLTSIIPKPLLPLGDRSILEIILHNLAKAGVTDAYLAINYRSEYFETYFRQNPPSSLRLHFCKEDKPLGTAGPLRLLEKELSDPFLVVNGDILTTLDFSEFYRFFVERDYDLVVGTKELSLPTNYGVVKAEDSLVLEIEEKPLIKAEVVAGIYCLSPTLISRIPANQPYDMPDLLRQLTPHGKLGRFLIEDYWLDIGHMENYEKAKEDMLHHSFLKQQAETQVPSPASIDN
jgi:NDP-mannose synthase